MNTNVWPESGGSLWAASLRQEAKRASLCFQPPAACEEWEALRRSLLTRMRAVAGTFPEPVPLAVEEHGLLRQDGYCIKKLTYQSRPGLRVTANLYVPDGRGPFPGVLGTHGHWPQGRLAARVAARGQTLAQEGFVALLVDAFGAGERGTVTGEFEYHGGPLGASLFNIGETLLGMQVYDNMRGVDLLQSLDCVDAHRIGVTGASGGGNQSMWLAAFDPRIRACVPVVSVGTFEAYITRKNCVCEVLPRGLTFMEEWAVLAMNAPQALLILNALRDVDPTFQVPEMIRSFNAAREVYRLYGAEERIAYQAIDLPHGYWPEMRRHMLGWFKRWLKDEGAGWPCAIPETPEIPEPDLRCFPGQTRPSAVASIVAYTTRRSAELKQAAAKAGLDAEQKRGELRELLTVEPAPAMSETGPVVSSRTGSVRCDKFSLQAVHGGLLPCVVLTPDGAAPGAAVLAVHSGGKACFDANGALEALLAEGKTICLADLRNMGETVWEPPERLGELADRTALWLGRTMIGEWVTDLLTVRAALESRCRITHCDLLAIGEPALAALAASALTDRFDALRLEQTLASFAIEGERPNLGMRIFVPRILEWGDVSLLIALTRGPVTVHRPVSIAGQALDDGQLAAWRREIEDAARRLGTAPRVALTSDAGVGARATRG